MGKPQTPPLPLWLIGFRNETLKPSLYHILLPHLHSCVVTAQLSTGADMHHHKVTKALLHWIRPVGFVKV
jgi:hypothetical protein